jgi:hypothetical protein
MKRSLLSLLLWLKPPALVAFLHLFFLMALVPIYLIATLLYVVVVTARERWIKWRLPPDS